MAQRRMFPNSDPPSITFPETIATLMAICSPAERQPSSMTRSASSHERSQDHGKKAWSIRCFYKFIENGTVSSIDLWSKTGKILHKISNEPGEGTMMQGRISVPKDADHLTLWFLTRANRELSTGTATSDEITFFASYCKILTLRTWA